MGYGFPAALTAKLLNPDKPVIVFIGDGGMGMYLGEIETAVRNNIPIIAVIFNDRALSLIQMNQERKGIPVYGTSFTNPDYVKLAESFGIQGFRVEATDEVRAAVNTALKSDKLTIIEAVINAQAYRI